MPGFTGCGHTGLPTDYGIDISGQGLLDVYGGHSEASARQQEEKEGRDSRVRLLNFG